MSKIEAIKNLLAEDTAALIYTPVSRHYLTDFESSLGYLFITKEKSVLFVDGRYIEAAKPDYVVIEKVERNITDYLNVYFPIVRASTLSLEDEFLKHIPESENQRKFKNNI